MFTGNFPSFLYFLFQALNVGKKYLVLDEIVTIKKLFLQELKGKILGGDPRVISIGLYIKISQDVDARCKRKTTFYWLIERAHPHITR